MNCHTLQSSWKANGSYKKIKGFFKHKDNIFFIPTAYELSKDCIIHVVFSKQQAHGAKMNVNSLAKSKKKIKIKTQNRNRTM